MSQKEWQSPFPWDSPPQRFLKLRNLDMERICRFLPEQRDLYEVCLVHQKWFKAASDVLWEAPQFRDPVSFQSFLASATTHKRLALAVRTLCLVLRDEEWQTVFRPLMDSELPRHTKKDNVLTRPELIMHFAQHCEKLKNLKIYGWQLTPSLVEAIGMVLTELESLTLVGSNPSFRGVFMQRNLLMRLKELRLDGDFLIEERFAEVISTRAESLKSLQISLAGMGRKELIRLCSGNLDLEEITFTKAQHMTDDDVQGVLQSFPNLRTFILEGTHCVTANTLLSLSTCKYLKHVELRANAASLKKSTAVPSSVAFKRSINYHLNLRTFIVENLNLPGDIVSQLPAFSNLATIGLRNCTMIDDAVLINALAQISRLTTIQLINCAGLSEKVLQQLWDGPSKSTIREVHIERCGPIKPRIVYQLCFRCAKTLKLLRLVGYKNVANSVLKDYALKNTDAETITLDEQMIDALVNVDLGSSPDLIDLPKNRTLTGEQIVMLAKILKLNVTELEKAMESVQKESNTARNDLAVTSSISESMHLQNKHLSRVTSIDKGMGNQRPTTPALWASANHSAIDDYLPNNTDAIAAAIPQIARPRARSQHSIESSVNTIPLLEQAEDSFAESPTSQSVSPASSTSPDLVMSPEFEAEPKYDSGDMSKDPEESNSELDNNACEMEDNELGDSDNNAYDVADNAYEEQDNAYEMTLSDEPPPTMDEWPSLTRSNPSNKAPELNLGGWGSTNALPWAKKTASAITSHTKTVTDRTSSGQKWTPHTLERHQHEWQQTTVEAQVTKPSKRRINNTHIMTLESEGWGTPKGYTPWSDLRQQGYAYEVLEEQKKTKFWDNSDGEWKVLNPDSPKPETQATASHQPIASTKLAAHKWPSIEKLSSGEHRRRQHPPVPTPSKGSASPTQRPLSNSFQEPIPQSRETYNAAGTLSSDDETINWEEDDGITIKTSPTQTPRTMYAKAPHKTPVPDQPRGRHAAPANRSGASRFEPPPGKLAGRWSEFKDTGIPTTSDHDKATDSKRYSDLLIDTSDIVKKADDFEKDDNLSHTSLLDSNVWRDMSSLSAPMQEPLQPQNPATPQRAGQLHVATSTKQNITAATLALPSVLVSSSTPLTSDGSVAPSTDQQVDHNPMDMLSPNMENAILEDALEPTVVGPPLCSSSPSPATEASPASPAAPAAPREPVDLANGRPRSPKPPLPLAPSLPVSATDSLRAGVDGEPTRAEDVRASATADATPAPTSGTVSDTTGSATAASASASSTTPKHKKLASFRFELPDRSDLPPLQLYQDVKLEDSIAEYCKEHDIEQMADYICRVLRPRYTALHTRRVLNKANAERKKKKRNEDNAEPS